ncbi:MAG TPA: hypothetical protein DCP91_11580 [Eggerthellaceae bacterium]|nr:hypothetical protein [Eggerthellaceae bacterium]
MDIAALVLSDYITLAELLGLWVMLGSNVHLSRRTITATRFVIILIFAEALLSIIVRWAAQLDYPTYARIFLTPTVWLLHPVIMLEMMGITQFAQKRRFLLYLPILISAPLLYSSQWTHLIYWFSPDNQYMSADGILRFYPVALFVLYAVLFVGAFAIQYARRGTTERKGILVSFLTAMVGAAIHVFLAIRVDFSTLFASLLLVYYLSLYVLTAKEDTLTHLLNRQCYYVDSANLKGRITAVASVDMNDLKKVNDSEGHDAGDTALVTVAECLTSDKVKNKQVYRIGGDEFAIFYLDKTEDEVKDDIERMRKNLSRTKYECAFGYEMVKDEEVEKAIIAADREMYTNKAIMKDTNERRIAAHRAATIRVMHEALGSGMWGMEFDENGNMTSVEWSPEFRRMIGYKDENDFPNKLESWSDLLHPDDRDAVLKEYNDTIQDYTGRKNYDVEYRLQVKSGEWRWFHAIGRLLRRENGTPLSYVGMFVDITDQKAAGL